MKLELDEEAGFASVKLGGVEKQLDLWKVWGDIEKMRARAVANPEGGDMLEEVVQYLANLGFTGKISHFTANEFLKWHAAAVEQEGKAGPGGSKPDSPGSTEPPSSTAPPE